MIAPIPVLLDRCPPFMRGDGSRGSLLQLPCGSGTLLDEIVASLLSVTARTPLVLPMFDASDEYASRAAKEWRGVGGLLHPDILSDPLSRFDPSDVLLIVSASTYPVNGLDLTSLMRENAVDRLMARHLLAFETSLLGTKEFVQSGTDGRVRRIQRYYMPTTWPFTAGVVASLVRVASLLTVPHLSAWSLDDLRRELSAKGVPSQDLPCQGSVFDLNDEAGVLALQEARVLSLVDTRAERGEETQTAVHLGSRVTVHPSARLLGPVVIGDGATIEAGALVVGPTMIGADAIVERGAVVAQCLVMPDAVVRSASTVRHRVIIEAAAGGSGVAHHTPHRRHAYVARPPVETKSQERRYLTIKGAVEPILAALALLIVSPLIATIAVLVKLTSKGPIFYGDRREGKDGKEFRCWKFRSMLVNADAMQAALAAQQYADGPQFKMVHDPRLTRVGGKLRSLNLDELPQLYNVLKGEMSLVGPRPSPFRENQICIPWRQGRLSVRPGITGLWQVCRKDRAEGDFHQWIFYDLTYVRHASFMVDLRIFAATIFTLGGRYPVLLESIVPNAGSIERRVVRAWGRVPTSASIAAKLSIRPGTRSGAKRRVDRHDVQ